MACALVRCSKKSFSTTLRLLATCFHLKVPGRLIKKLTPSQLYQTSIPNCIRLANSKPFPISINMFYRLEGSHLMSKTFLFDSVRKQLLGEVNLDFCCHHKISSLDLSLLQRNLCLVLFQVIATFGEFTHPLPELKRSDTFRIEIHFCQTCIPVVIAALQFLLNTLSYFHVFLPTDHAFSLRASLYSSKLKYSYDVYWNSTRPVGCLAIPDSLFDNSHNPRRMVFVSLQYHPKLPHNDPIYQRGCSFRNPSVYDHYTSFESHSHLLPKSWSWQQLHQWMYITVICPILFRKCILCSYRISQVSLTLWKCTDHTTSGDSRNCKYIQVIC